MTGAPASDASHPRQPGGRGDPDGPIRTCVGCRRRAPARTLQRYVARSVDGAIRVIADPDGTAPGRGAWLHPEPGCAESARKKSAFRRALRVTGPIDDSLT